MINRLSPFVQPLLESRGFVSTNRFLVTPFFRPNGHKKAMIWKFFDMRNDFSAYHDPAIESKELSPEKVFQLSEIVLSNPLFAFFVNKEYNLGLADKVVDIVNIKIRGTLRIFDGEESLEMFSRTAIS